MLAIVARLPARCRRCREFVSESGTKGVTIDVGRGSRDDRDRIAAADAIAVSADGELLAGDEPAGFARATGPAALARVRGRSLRRGVPWAEIRGWAGGR